VDNSDNENGSSLETADSSVVDAALENFAGGLSGLSKPIKVNAIKAFGQLCTALIDIPVAYLEGVSTEKRSETQARVNIMRATGEQIANQLNIPVEYAERAERKYGARIIREQINLDEVSKIAANELLIDPPADSKEESTVEEINADWLNIFEKEACAMSSESMRLLFGKVLAGEIRKPSTFSIKAVKLLSEINGPVAHLFQKLCSLSISQETDSGFVDIRVPSLEGNASRNVLLKYGLSFKNLNKLNEYGLIIPDYNSHMSYWNCINHKGDPRRYDFFHQKKAYGLVPEDPTTFKKTLYINGVELTTVGKELFKIVEISREEKYTEKLKAFFLETHNLRMTIA